MMNGITPEILRDYLRLLVSLRLSDYSDRLVHGIRYGRCFGFTTALHVSGQITADEWFALDRLASSAGEHAGEPFPDKRNAGPVIPVRLLRERGQPLVKPSARVLADECLSEVPAPVSRPELRLLCLLVKDRDGKARSLPVHTMRPMPPRVLRAGRWSLASDPTFELRETHAIRPAAEVLERCARQRQAHALRPAARTFSACGVSHVA